MGLKGRKLVSKMRLALRKSKMISFRLSPEEYRTLQDACEKQGVRSISDLARTAMQRLVTSNGHAQVPLSEEVRDLQDRMAEIAVKVERLSQIVESKQ